MEEGKAQMELVAKHRHERGLATWSKLKKRVCMMVLYNHDKRRC